MPRLASDWVLPVALFAAAEMAARVMGIRMVIPWDYWQLLDADALRQHPIASLCLLHSQPPLLNALLAGVTFNPAANFNGSFNIATSVSDGVAPAVTGTKVVTGTAVNDAPTATNLNTAETYTEDTALNLTDIVVSDVDSASVTVTLTLGRTPPEESLATPRMDPVGNWAFAGIANKIRTASEMMLRLKTFR